MHNKGKGIQLSIYMCLFSPKLLSHPGCHITFYVPYSMSLLVIHLKYSSMYMSFTVGMILESLRSSRKAGGWDRVRKREGSAEGGRGWDAQSQG